MTAFTEWLRADAIWNRAVFALLERDYTTFDALMHEFRTTTRDWESTRGRGAAEKAAPLNNG